jgi:hypothetical protein
MTRTPVRLTLLAALALATSQLGACHAHVAPSQPAPEIAVQQAGGPPPHAPAHGYRRKHASARHEVELVFDSGLGVYVVVGFPGVYFHADHYFRYFGTSWQVSIRPDAEWSVAVQDDVPPGLRKQKQGKAKRGGPPGPAKQRD